MATIYDVAARAGVSPKTVSRVINNASLVRAETRQKVLDIIKELDYFPSLYARGISAVHTKVIGIYHCGSSFFNDALKLRTRILSGFETALASTGYRLLLHSAIMHEADNKGLEHLAADVDGVFVVGSPSSNERQQMARLLQKGVPVVSAGRRQLSGVEAYCVAPDNAANVALAVQQFSKDGRQRIGLVLSTMLGEHNQDRLMGYVGALAENKVEYEPDLVFVQKSSEKDEALQVWLKDKGKPDAVFVAEEDLAVNLYKKARQLGILVPDQLAITTYYDNGTAAMLGSALSIIERYDFEIGHQAASMLLSLIGGRPVQPRLKLIKGQLIIPFTGSGREPS